jgi:hypothetical protein
MPTKRKAKMSEATLQTHIAKLLNSYAKPNICWFACPNGEQRSAKTGQRLKQQGVRTGAADLMFIKAGQFIGLELKTEIGAMSKAQHQFKEDLERAGGIYLVAFGLEAAISLLIDLEVFRPNIHISTKGLL